MCSEEAVGRPEEVVNSRLIGLEGSNRLCAAPVGVDIEKRMSVTDVGGGELGRWSSFFRAVVTTGRRELFGSVSLAIWRRLKMKIVGGEEPTGAVNDQRPEVVWSWFSVLLQLHL